MPAPSLTLAPSLFLAPAWENAPDSTVKAMQNALGILVAGSSKLLPQSGTTALFTISGGRILLTSILGLVTTRIQSQVTNTRLQSIPLVGSIGDLCTAADIAGRETGSTLTVTGMFGSALRVTNAGAAPTVTQPMVIPAGTLALTCGAGSAGAVSWLATYAPLDDGATMTNV
jgi:hypothetical protein